jgi:hypothetical protein
MRESVMRQKMLELLATFRVRAVDGALKGRMCYTQEAFQLAATELEAAILESAPEEPPNLVAFIPPPVLELVHEALHFDARDEDSWAALGQAALSCQSGPS